MGDFSRSVILLYRRFRACKGSFADGARGRIVLVGGLAYAALILGLPSHWIVVIVLVIIGGGIMVGVVKTRACREPGGLG